MCQTSIKKGEAGARGLANHKQAQPTNRASRFDRRSKRSRRQGLIDPTRIVHAFPCAMASNRNFVQDDPGLVWALRCENPKNQEHINQNA